MLGVFAFAPKPSGSTPRLSTVLTAGTDGSYAGYSAGNVLSNFGSVGSGAINGGGTLEFLGDQLLNNFFVVIAIGADPGAGYISDILIDGNSVNAVCGALSYSGYSGGYATWACPATYGIMNGVGYTIEIQP